MGRRRGVPYLRMGSGGGMFDTEHLQWGELQEAAGLLAARGYGGVRAQELARATRRSVGSLYREYGNKAGVARAVRAEAERELAWRGTCAWRVADSAAGDFRTSFLAVWDALANWAGEQPQLFAFTYLHPAVEDAGEDGPARTRGETQARELLVEVLGAGLARGVLRPAPVWLMTGVVWGALAELVRASQARGRRLDNAEIALTGEAVWGALEAPSARASGRGSRGVGGGGAGDTRVHPLHTRGAGAMVEESAARSTTSAVGGEDAAAATPAGSRGDGAVAATPAGSRSSDAAAPLADPRVDDAAKRLVGSRADDTAAAVPAGARHDDAARAIPAKVRGEVAGAGHVEAGGADLAPAAPSPLESFLETMAPDAEDPGAWPPDSEANAPAADPGEPMRTVEDVLRRWPRGTEEERWFAQTAMDRGELTLELYLAWRAAIWSSPAMAAQLPVPPELERFQDMWDDPSWDDLGDRS